jgi:hypothetical protein
MEQMRAEANTGRENLRGLIEQKLEQNIAQQSDNAKVLREELGGTSTDLEFGSRNLLRKPAGFSSNGWKM